MRTQASRLTSDECRGREVQSTRHANHHKADRSPESDQLADQFLRHAVENKVGRLDGLQAARLPLLKLFWPNRTTP
jgi:hypothetical protein